MMQLVEPHLWAIAIVLLVLLLLGPLFYGAGIALKPQIRKLLDAVFKRITGMQTELNLKIGETGEEMKRSPEQTTVVCDPEKCVGFVEIKQQQKRNVADIQTFNLKIDHLSELFFKKLTFIGQQNAVILRAMVKAGQLNESDIPKE